MIVERKVGEYQLIGANSEYVCSSDGIRAMACMSMADVGRFDTFFIVGANPILLKGIDAILDWFRLHARGGTALG